MADFVHCLCLQQLISAKRDAKLAEENLQKVRLCPCECVASNSTVTCWCPGPCVMTYLSLRSYLPYSSLTKYRHFSVVNNEQDKCLVSCQIRNNIIIKIC